jgi:hypothetical protein
MERTARFWTAGTAADDSGICALLISRPSEVSATRREATTDLPVLDLGIKIFPIYSYLLRKWEGQFGTPQTNFNAGYWKDISNGSTTV